MIRQVVIYLTRRCNLRCEYCYIPNITSGELSTNKLCEIVEFVAQKIQPEMMIFFGGEPFLRQDIGKVVDCANATGIHYTVITNGTLKKYEAIKKLKSLTLSIDLLPWQVSSDTAEIMPEIVRKSEAGFQLLTEVLEFDLPELVVSTIVTKYNTCFLPEIVEWMSERGIWTIPGIVHTVRDSDFAFRGNLDLNVTQQQAVWIANKMLEMKSRGYLIHNVNAYFRNLPKYADLSWKCSLLDYFIINSNGYLLACHDWPGTSFSQLDFFDFITQEHFDYQELQELYSKDVRDCPGCYYNHKLQLLYSKREDDVLVHTP